MKRLAGLTVLVALLALFSAPRASAQSIFVGGGLSFPAGSLDDAADQGWMGTGGLTFDVGEDGLWIGAEGFYSTHDNTGSSDKTNVIGVMGELGFSFHEPGEAGIYVFGGSGWVVNQLSPDVGDNVNHNELGFITGAGYDFPIGSATGWIEGRYVTTDNDTRTAGVVAGISFGFGGG